MRFRRLVVRMGVLSPAGPFPGERSGGGEGRRVWCSTWERSSAEEGAVGETGACEEGMFR